MKKSSIPIENNLEKQNGKEHDSMFAALASHKEAAIDYLSHNLPKALLDAVDLNSVEACRCKFIQNFMNPKRTDVLWKMNLTIEDNRLYVFFLNEQQATPLKHMPLRAMLYELLTMQEHYNTHKKIPLVYTIVYYNGERKWNHSNNLKDIIDAPKDLVDTFALQPFKLIQLRDIEDEVLKQSLYAGTMGMLMKHIWDLDILPVLKELKSALQELERKAPDFVSRLLWYTYRKGEIPDENAFEDFIQDTFSDETRENAMTLARKHEMIGEQRGMQQGMQQGMHQREAEIARNMLQAGSDLGFVEKTTGLDRKTVEKIKEEVKT